MTEPGSLAAGIVLAGGRGSRLGSVDKPALTVGGETLIERALAALRDLPIVVVGPNRQLSRPVFAVREDPAGAGPAAAVAAGVDRLRSTGDPVLSGPPLSRTALIAVLAADLPAVTAETLNRLVSSLNRAPTSDGAILIDADDRQQLLLGVWRFDALVDARRQRSNWTGAALRAFLEPLSRITVAALGDEAADIDTAEELASWTDR